MNQETKQKVLKTLQIIAQAAVAVAAVWLAISCTMSMSISKNNSNSTQQTEQSTKADSVGVVITPKF